MDPTGFPRPGQQKMHPQQAPPKYDGANGTPVYDRDNGGHYGASAHIAAAGQAPPQEFFTGQWANVNQGLSGHYRDILNTYWQQQVNELETEDHNYKFHQLPLARIKKVMKADPEVKMISAEAPILFAKGCDIFITELTMRAWIHAEENKRRTLQRSDIASALGKSDMFDFLIDIVPREEAQSHKRSAQSGGGSHHPNQPANPPPPGVPQQQPMHPQQPHHMPPPGYEMPQQMGGEHDFRGQQPQMYGGPPGGPQMQPDPNNPYGGQMQFLDQNTYQQYSMGQPSQVPIRHGAPYSADPSSAGGEGH